MQIHIQGLQAVAGALDESFGQAVNQLCQALDAGHRLVFCGLGKSLHVGRKIAATFNSLGCPATVLHASEAHHGDLGLVQAGDAVLAMSFSGATGELLALVAPLRQRGATLLALTRSPESRLARAADVHIALPIPQEACPFDLAPTTSSLVMLAVGDALAMAVMERRGFTREDFSRLHPAGSIGNALRPVREIMRQGDRLARLGPEGTLHEALLTMTRCRCGVVGVVGADSKLLGVLTDGDVRRHLVESDGDLQAGVTEAMTPEPQVIDSEAPISQALELFAANDINDLLVVESDGRLCGMVDLQDLPKLQVFQPLDS